jgi:biopolymer transport protein ExbD
LTAAEEQAMRDELTPRSEPNVTPFLDILLVLLVAWMVVVLIAIGPTMYVHTPPRCALMLTCDSDARPAMLRVRPGGRFVLNGEFVPAERLGQRLAELYATHPGTPLFVDGDGRLPYERIIEALDVAAGAGGKIIGIAPR